MRTVFEAERVRDDPRILADPALCELVSCTANQRAAIANWERAIDTAIRTGHPERLIAKAADISGPAVHARKKKLQTALTVGRGDEDG